jgi:hypothetical protein
MDLHVIQSNSTWILAKSSGHPPYYVNYPLSTIDGPFEHPKGDSHPACPFLGAEIYKEWNSQKYCEGCVNGQ